MRYTFEKKLLVVSETKSGKTIEWLSREYRIDRKVIKIRISPYEKYREIDLYKVANVATPP